LYRSDLPGLRPQGRRRRRADDRRIVPAVGRNPAARGDRLLRHDRRAGGPGRAAGRQRGLRLPHPGLRDPRLCRRRGRDRERQPDAAGDLHRAGRAGKLAGMSATAAPQPVLSLQKVRKEFGGLVAIEACSLDLYAGEIVALVGDNGAGKSTLVKLISGVHQPTAGSIAIDGQPVSFADASAARRRGIEVVYQDLALADSQPVFMNMFLGRELVQGPLRRLDKKRMASETQALLNELDVRVPSVKASVRDLS